MARSIRAIESERLILRRWRPEDREPFARLNADPRVMEFMLSVLTREQSDAFANRIGAHFEQHGFGLFAVERRGEGSFIGFIGLQRANFEAPFTPCVEIGWRLAADLWNQGLATEGGHAVVRHSFEVLGLEELVSFTAVINTRSQRVMQKIGMGCNRAEDFDHPRVPEGHRLRRHVLSRLSRSDWRRASQ